MKIIFKKSFDKSKLKLDVKIRLKLDEKLRMFFNNPFDDILNNHSLN